MSVLSIATLELRDKKKKIENSWDRQRASLGVWRTGTESAVAPRPLPPRPRPRRPRTPPPPQTARPCEIRSQRQRDAARGPGVGVAPDQGGWGRPCACVGVVHRAQSPGPPGRYASPAAAVGCPRADAGTTYSARSVAHADAAITSPHAATADGRGPPLKTTTTTPPRRSICEPPPSARVAPPPSTTG